MHWQGDDMCFGPHTARELVEEFGSPLYVYEAQSLRQQSQILLDSFKNMPVEIHYACKANTNIAIMSFLRNQGFKVDCVSRGEVLAAKKAGFSSPEMTLTGNNLSSQDMSWACDQEILMIFDSVDQVDRYGQLKPGGRLGVRLNHMGMGHHDHVITGGPESKFGVVPEDYPHLLETIQKHDLKLVGIHQHIGSGVLDVADWLTAMDVLIASLKEFPPLEWVDFGGGFGIPYAPDEKALDLARLAQEMGQRWSQVDPEGKMKIHLQPGRFLVAESGYLLMTVQSRKKTKAHLFVGTDSGFHHHIRHPLYQAYHPIWNATGGTRPKQKTAVTGNICESGDLFTHGRDLSEVKVGDILALGKAGAYGFCMASRYNSQLLPAEVLVESQGPILIRRRECYDRLFEDQEGFE